MVQAILGGIKTQTRRPVKFKTDPLGHSGQYASIHPDGSGKCGVAWSPREVSAEETARLYPGEEGFKCPFGEIGTVLWVRETWAMNYPFGNYRYAASDTPNILKKWKPSIHMPRKACRLFLRITDIRVERLDEISEEDAVAEGVQENRCDNPAKCPSELCKKDGCAGIGEYYRYPVNFDDLPCDSAVESFETLWESINGKGSWGPTWVWVVNFERIDKPDNF